MLEQYAQNGLFNGVALVAVNGQIKLKKAYGYRNAQTRAPHRVNTRFPIYSITKSITASVILNLVENGRLNLNDPLSRFYPSLPDGEKITIEHLLSHSSGLYPYNNDFSMPTASEAEMINYLYNQSLRFTPGSKWEYCNTGYFLLGFIIQKVTGQPYQTAVQELILRTADMRQTGFNFRDSLMPKKAVGYSVLVSDYTELAHLYPDEELRAAGSIWSTVDDLYRFSLAWQNGQLLGKETMETASRPVSSNYALGWFVDSVYNQKIISHTGGAAGFRSLLVQIPAINACIVLLSNSELTNLIPLKNQLLELLLAGSATCTVAQPLTHAEIASLGDVYHFSPDRWMYISPIKKGILAQVSGQQPAVLLHTGNLNFTAPEMKGGLQFTGPVLDTATLYRKGQALKGHKVNAGWGIAGTALANGWQGPDMKLKPHHSKPDTWIAESVQLSDGVIKFRYNNEWTNNLGLRTGQRYLEMNGDDITVKAGRYTIILTMKKQKHLRTFSYSMIPVKSSSH